METPTNSSTMMNESPIEIEVIKEDHLFNAQVDAREQKETKEHGKPATRNADFEQKNPKGEATQPNTGAQIPSREASPEEWASFYNQLGRPANAQDYELPVPEGDSGEFAKEIAPLLHEVGLSKTQAQDLAKGWNGYVDKMQQQQQAQQAQEQLAQQERSRHEVESLRHEWQGRYDANLEQARRAKQQFLPPEQADDIINAIENSIGVKATLQMLHSIGKGLAEDDAAGLQRQQSMPFKNAAEVLFDKR